MAIPVHNALQINRQFQHRDLEDTEKDCSPPLRRLCVLRNSVLKTLCYEETGRLPDVIQQIVLKDHAAALHGSLISGLSFVELEQCLGEIRVGFLGDQSFQ